jgi:hypothetical protein
MARAQRPSKGISIFAMFTGLYGYVLANARRAKEFLRNVQTGIRLAFHPFITERHDGSIGNDNHLQPAERRRSTR